MDKTELTSLPDTLIQIPPEIREKIYNKLEQKDALNLRLASKEYRDDVDSIFKFGFRLNDKMPAEQMKFLLDKRMQECQVVEMLKEPATLPLVKFPNIQCLEIEMSKISPINFHTLMTECSRFVKILRLNLQEVTENDRDLASFKIPTNLSVLYVFEKLKVLIICHHDFFKQSLVRYHSVLSHIVESAARSKLKTLNVDLWDSPPGQTEAEHLVFKLLAQQSKTLETFQYNNTSCSTIPTTSFDSSSVETLAGTLKTCCLALQTPSSDYDLLSVKFLQCQNQLNFLNIEISNCGKQQWESLPPIIINNRLTLKKVFLTVDLTFPGTFDLSIFQNCENLEDLSFEYCEDELNVTNFNKLPKSIKHLHILGYKSSSTDLDYWDNFVEAVMDF